MHYISQRLVAYQKPEKEKISNIIRNTLTGWKESHIKSFSLTCCSVYVGCSKSECEGKYTNWHHSAPRSVYESCVYIEGLSGRWDVDYCSSVKYYICEFCKIYRTDKFVMWNALLCHHILEVIINSVKSSPFWFTTHFIHSVKIQQKTIVAKSSLFLT